MHVRQVGLSKISEKGKSTYNHLYKQYGRPVNQLWSSSELKENDDDRSLQHIIFEMWDSGYAVKSIQSMVAELMASDNFDPRVQERVQTGLNDLKSLRSSVADTLQAHFKPNDTMHSRAYDARQRNIIAHSIQSDSSNRLVNSDIMSNTERNLHRRVSEAKKPDHLLNLNKIQHELLQQVSTLLNRGFNVRQIKDSVSSKFQNLNCHESNISEQVLNCLRGVLGLGGPPALSNNDGSQQIDIGDDDNKTSLVQRIQALSHRLKSPSVNATRTGDSSSSDSEMFNDSDAKAPLIVDEVVRNQVTFGLAERSSILNDPSSTLASASSMIAKSPRQPPPEIQVDVQLLVAGSLAARDMELDVDERGQRSRRTLGTSPSRSSTSASERAATRESRALYKKRPSVSMASPGPVSECARALPSPPIEDASSISTSSTKASTEVQPQGSADPDNVVPMNVDATTTHDEDPNQHLVDGGEGYMLCQNAIINHRTRLGDRIKKLGALVNATPDSSKDLLKERQQQYKEATLMFNEYNRLVNKIHKYQSENAKRYSRRQEKTIPRGDELTRAPNDDASAVPHCHDAAGEEKTNSINTSIVEASTSSAESTASTGSTESTASTMPTKSVASGLCRAPSTGRVLTLRGVEGCNCTSCALFFRNSQLTDGDVVVFDPKKTTYRHKFHSQDMPRAVVLEKSADNLLFSIYVMTPMNGISKASANPSDVITVPWDSILRHQASEVEDEVRQFDFEKLSTGAQFGTVLAANNMSTNDALCAILLYAAPKDDPNSNYKLSIVTHEDSCANISLISEKLSRALLMHGSGIIQTAPAHNVSGLRTSEDDKDVLVLDHIWTGILYDKDKNAFPIQAYITPSHALPTNINLLMSTQQMRGNVILNFVDNIVELKDMLNIMRQLPMVDHRGKEIPKPNPASQQGANAQAFVTTLTPDHPDDFAVLFSKVDTYVHPGSTTAVLVGTEETRTFDATGGELYPLTNISSPLGARVGVGMTPLSGGMAMAMVTNLGDKTLRIAKGAPIAGWRTKVRPPPVPEERLTDSEDEVAIPISGPTRHPDEPIHAPHWYSTLTWREKIAYLQHQCDNCGLPEQPDLLRQRGEAIALAQCRVFEQRQFICSLAKDLMENEHKAWSVLQQRSEEDIKNALQLLNIAKTDTYLMIMAGWGSITDPLNREKTSEVPTELAKEVHEKEHTDSRDGDDLNESKQARVMFTAGRNRSRTSLPYDAVEDSHMANNSNERETKVDDGVVQSASAPALDF